MSNVIKSYSFNKAITEKSKELSINLPTKVILSLDSAKEYLPEIEEFKHGVEFNVKYNNRLIAVVVNFNLRDFNFIII